MDLHSEGARGFVPVDERSSGLVDERGFVPVDVSLGVMMLGVKVSGVKVSDVR